MVKSVATHPWTEVNERIAQRCVCCAGRKLNRAPAILMPFVANRAFGWEPVEITDDWGLRDIKSGMAYPLCNSVQCTDCGALFLDILFSDQEMAALYSGYRNEDYTKQRDRFEPGYRQRDLIIQQGATQTAEVERFLSSHLPARPEILDWGGDTGRNTPFAGRRESLDIFDISNRPLVEGASRVDAATIERTSYDLIVLSHVLEHLPWPAKTIAEICNVMGDDTVLYIETPYEDLMRSNGDVGDLHLKKRYWHEHVNFFTVASLKALLQTCGLRIIDMRFIVAEGGGKLWHVFAIACKRRQLPAGG
jgi:hypothetical protein